ncbi:hypothetical protein [uncultured Traorella sp.]|uniref:hypothetical protein n=1 Tax=uncultured Traorella sp. TaxID=1929048 RepID=UPI0025DE0C83|nr:hypothetical protein [uncultured Traorella sp.]
MNKKKESVPSRKQIAEYWKGKYISKNLEVIDDYEEDALPVISDWGEPECWACCEFNLKIYNNPNYEKLRTSKNYMIIWNLPEVKFLQKAHIKSKMLGGENVPSNYFLLCKECHQESPDFQDPRYFFAYIRNSRKNEVKIRKRRENEMMRAIYELAFQLNKNIFTIDKAYKNLPNSFEKMGLHITNYSLYTLASGVVDVMDDLNLDLLSDEEFEKMKNEFLKYDIILKK